LSETGGKPAFGALSRDDRLSDRVATELLDAIIKQGLRPGDRLPPERELAEQFSVSRTVVREAVRSLAGKGIIDARPGRGLTVAAVDASAVTQSMSLFLHGSDSIDYRRVHEVRAMLEVQIAGLATERATDEELKALADVCDRLERAQDDVEAASREDLAFHRLLARSTHNELFEMLLDAVGAPLVSIRRETFALPGRVAVALQAHRDILAHLVARDVRGARAQMREHLEDVEHVWEGLAGPIGLIGSAAKHPRHRKPPAVR
jgi:GntR family transcriptional regulator, transcriptional repressor for pyruvate dehydrogenase complex